MHVSDIMIRMRVTTVDAPDRESLGKVIQDRLGVRELTVHVTKATMVPANETDLRLWQETHAVGGGTQNQRDRWQAGLLPDAELTDIARTELFRPFGTLVQRRKMTFADIPHPRNHRGLWECSAEATEKSIDWSTTTRPNLSAIEWRTLIAVQDAAAELRRHPWLQRIHLYDAVAVETREHRGMCKRCLQVASERSALVTVRWAGRTLSREYAL